ncbi:MAG: MBL fold metallo-hydrolase [Clostridia bacterium]|nr:MBL fold metallo-hydrolase [Clostridia bacterium]
MSSAEIVDITFAQGDMPEAFFKPNSPADKFRRILFRCFLIKTEERKILVDAGCETMPGWTMYNFIGPIKALANQNLTPEDITDVIITHTHSDHIEGIPFFEHSNIYIQRDEYESGKGYFTDSMKVILFNDEYRLCDAVRVVKIASHSIGSSVVEVIDGTDQYVLSGDEFYVWDTVNELKERIQKPDYAPADESERKKAEFLKRYNDWKIVLCHSEF